MRRLALKKILNADALAPGGVDRSVLIVVVVVVIRVIGISPMVAPVIGHRVSDCSASDAANDSANRTADDSAGHRPPDRAGDQTVFVGKGNLRRGDLNSIAERKIVVLDTETSWNSAKPAVARVI